MTKHKRSQPASTLPSKKNNGGEMTGVEVRHEFSGPIPPPTILDGYERILPGAAERIMKLAEDEARHRRSVEILTRKAEIRLAKGEHYQIYLAQLLAFIITIAFVIGSVFLLYNGKALTGSLLASGALAAVVAAFLAKGRQKK